VRVREDVGALDRSALGYPSESHVFKLCLCYQTEERETQKATNLRDYGNLAGACHKVIECLYIILPSYNMYLITFWQASWITHIKHRIFLLSCICMNIYSWLKLN